MKLDPLTFKQRKWLKIYLELGNATEAAMRTYDCKDRESASQIGWENLRKLDFGDLMEESGLTDDKLNKKLVEGLDATRSVSARITNKDAGVDTDDFIDVPDFQTRHKYLETALKLKQRLVEKSKVETTLILPKPITDIGIQNNDSNQTDQGSN